ncbi:MAG: DegT/DnrJ/EryC1/StrS family aminotransferase [Candidatus Omnitrophota bacterium]|nr:DegT/DnrJ/EryC1/StrS family aminotransferase [Candidatus Omnitrophota bacterium]
MIPILDLKKQIVSIRKELDLAIKKVIDNANFILGAEVRQLEEEVQKYCSLKYAVGVSNGTDAIRLALAALGIRSGEGVICPSFTYYATAGAVASIGAIPVFADIDPDTYTISSQSIEEVLRKRRNFKIKAVIPVHLYGQCANMDEIFKLAAKFKLKVIEDAAQAFGAEYLPRCEAGLPRRQEDEDSQENKGKKAGTLGDCGTVSFFPGKNLGAFGDAGMILTNNTDTYERLIILRNQGNKEKYYHTMLGYNHRLDALQAAVLRVKLKYLDCWNKKRQENASYYDKKLKGLEVKIPYTAEYSTHIYHQYVLKIRGQNVNLMEYLKKKGIEARVYYPLPLHLQECFKYLGYKKGDFPESEKASVQTLAIPVYPDLTMKQMNYIVSSIKGFLK